MTVRKFKKSLPGSCWPLKQAAPKARQAKHVKHQRAERPLGTLPGTVVHGIQAEKGKGQGVRAGRKPLLLLRLSGVLWLRLALRRF